jgi:hypothetical protein
LAKEGDSFLQSGHQVVKKFRITIFPLNSLSEIFPPPNSFNVKSGASIGALNSCTLASKNWAWVVGILKNGKTNTVKKIAKNRFIFHPFLSLVVSALSEPPLLINARKMPKA